MKVSGPFKSNSLQLSDKLDEQLGIALSRHAWILFLARICVASEYKVFCMQMFCPMLCVHKRTVSTTQKGDKIHAFAQ